MKKTLRTRYQALKKRFGLTNRLPAITNQKRIVIFLHQLQPLDASWVLFADHSEIQQTVLHGDLSDLTALANQYEIHVIIPGQDVLLTHAELPKLTRERLLQALPYAVEDKLIDEISQLHFAVGKFAPHGTPVAIINKDKLSHCLTDLSQYGITPHTLIPATLALPWTEHQWYASCGEHISTVRTNQFSGFACDRSNLPTLLQLQALETASKPECVHVDNFSQTSVTLNIDPILVNETTLTENHFLEKIAILLGANPYINLLQGAYRPKRKATQTKKVWVATGIFAAAWFTLYLCSNLGSFFILHHAKSVSEAEISQIYRQQFPTATSVVAPRERMESALKKASAAANKNYFLALLGLLGDTANRSTDIHFLNLSYQDSRMNLTVTANSFDSLDTFTKNLTQEGLKVKQQNATSSGQKVKADVLITKGDI
jgi:general secretion pathway protein L